MIDIEALREGSTRDWNMLVEKYSQKIYNLAAGFSKNSDEASDITQEVFMKLYQNISKYRNEHSLNAWLFRVARNHCIDHWRKNRKHRNSDSMDENRHSSPHRSPEEESIHESQITRMRRILRTLPPAIRLLVTMRDIQGYSYRRISEESGLPLGTVKSRINRGRLQLAEKFNREKDHEGM